MFDCQSLLIATLNTVVLFLSVPVILAKSPTTGRSREPLWIRLERLFLAPS
jgi:hypothetical protein